MQHHTEPRGVSAGWWRWWWSTGGGGGAAADGWCEWWWCVVVAVVRDARRCAAVRTQRGRRGFLGSRERDGRRRHTKLPRREPTVHNRLFTGQNILMVVRLLELQSGRMPAPALMLESQAVSTVACGGERLVSCIWFQLSHPLHGFQPTPRPGGGMFQNTSSTHFWSRKMEHGLGSSHRKWV